MNYNALIRQAGIDNYYLQPKECKQCGKIIAIGNRPPRYMAKISFCSRGCINNSMRKEKKEKKTRYALGDSVFFTKYKDLTKGDIFNKYKSWQSARSRIQKIARVIYNNNKEYKCIICGYNKHIEVAHIKAVSTFEDTALILEEVNSINNMIGLCPTHHWEYDAGLLDIENIKN